MARKKKKQGFAALSKRERTEIARLGGEARARSRAREKEEEFGDGFILERDMDDTY